MSDLDDALIIEADQPLIIAEVEIDYIAIPGPQGDQGETGPAGAGILSGSGAPGGGTGSDGDFYLDYTNDDIYGPKAGGTWPAAVSLVGPQGDEGPTGTTGLQGLSMRSGSGVPSSGLGNNGDFYIDTTAHSLYGPKTSGAWGGSTSLIGPAGEDGEFVGNTVLYGTAAPTTEGSNGDFYIRTTTNFIYGPKASGSWPTGVSLVGPTGTTGTAGTPGAAGADGRTILSGTSDPGGGTGANGDFYIRTDTHVLFGPKASGTWPGGFSLVGPTGSTGATGGDGDDGADGVDGNTILSGSGVPDGLLGANGDLYYRTSNSSIYGPKASGSWGSATSLLGATGATGTSILNGTTVPSNGTGNNGDFYLRTTTSDLYGPKAAGAWPGSPTNLIGPQGTTGTTGATGATILSGTAVPTTEGANGDYYLRTTNGQFYGPKTAGAWGSGISLIGPTGTTGTAGNTVLYGTAAPTTEGVDGNFYIRTTTNFIYGPKASGVWPAGTSLVGPTGTTGTAGTNGNTLLYGTAAPTTEGVNGDFYYRTTTATIYGPKASGTWPAGTSLIIGPGPVTLTDGATPALDASLGRHFRLTAAGNRTIAIPTNPTSGQRILIEHIASGGARTLALNTGTGGFAFGADITGLTATTSGLTDYIGCLYDSTANKWRVIAYVKGY